jgi:hypothetical protein
LACKIAFRSLVVFSLARALALAALAVLVFIGLWERHAQEATALGFSGIYERYLASQAGFPTDPTAYRKATEIALMPQASTTGGSAAFEE